MIGRARHNPDRGMNVFMPRSAQARILNLGLKCSRRASAMARKVSKISVLFDLPPMMKRTFACRSQWSKQMRATSFILLWGGLPPKSDEMIASSPSS